LRQPYDALTGRERDVMQLVVSGLLDKQIAA
jgi:FixJ family two-component response regulator